MKKNNNSIIQNNNNIYKRFLVIWSYGAMVITSDFDSDDPSSTLGRTFRLFLDHLLLVTSRIEILTPRIFNSFILPCTDYFHQLQYVR